MTSAQLAILATAIAEETDPEFVQYRNDGSTGLMAEWYNQDSSTVVWKTNLTEHEIVGEESPDGTYWDWVAYTGTTVDEKMAWERMFNGTYSINPSLVNVRQGIADIFGGPSGADQRTHLLAMAKRFATRGEALFAGGAGTNATPAVLVFEGDISNIDVIRAINL